jgi:hypothetical protein
VKTDAEIRAMRDAAFWKGVALGAVVAIAIGIAVLFSA